MLGLNAQSVSNGIVSKAVTILILPQTMSRSVLSLSPLSTVQTRQKFLSQEFDFFGMVLIDECCQVLDVLPSGEEKIDAGIIGDDDAVGST